MTWNIFLTRHSSHPHKNKSINQLHRRKSNNNNNSNNERSRSSSISKRDSHGECNSDSDNNSSIKIGSTSNNNSNRNDKINSRKNRRGGIGGIGGISSDSASIVVVKKSKISASIQSPTAAFHLEQESDDDENSRSSTTEPESETESESESESETESESESTMSHTHGNECPLTKPFVPTAPSTSSSSTAFFPNEEQRKVPPPLPPSRNSSDASMMTKLDNLIASLQGSTSISHDILGSSQLQQQQSDGCKIDDHRSDSMEFEINRLSLSRSRRRNELMHDNSEHSERFYSKLDELIASTTEQNLTLEYISQQLGNSNDNNNNNSMEFEINRLSQSRSTMRNELMDDNSDSSYFYDSDAAFEYDSDVEQERVVVVEREKEQSQHPEEHFLPHIPSDDDDIMQIIEKNNGRGRNTTTINSTAIEGDDFLDAFKQLAAITTAIPASIINIDSPIVQKSTTAQRYVSKCSPIRKNSEMFYSELDELIASTIEQNSNLTLTSEYISQQLGNSNDNNNTNCDDSTSNAAVNQKSNDVNYLRNVSSVMEEQEQDNNTFDDNNVIDFMIENNDDGDSADDTDSADNMKNSTIHPSISYHPLHGSEIRLPQTTETKNPNSSFSSTTSSSGGHHYHYPQKKNVIPVPSLPSMISQDSNRNIDVISSSNNRSSSNQKQQYQHLQSEEGLVGLPKPIVQDHENNIDQNSSSSSAMDNTIKREEKKKDTINDSIILNNGRDDGKKDKNGRAARTLTPATRIMKMEDADDDNMETEWDDLIGSEQKLSQELEGFSTQMMTNLAERDKIGMVIGSEYRNMFNRNENNDGSDTNADENSVVSDNSVRDESLGSDSLEKDTITDDGFLNPSSDGITTNTAVKASESFNDILFPEDPPINACSMVPKSLFSLSSDPSDGLPNHCEPASLPLLSYLMLPSNNSTCISNAVRSNHGKLELRSKGALSNALIVDPVSFFSILLCCNNKSNSNERLPMQKKILPSWCQPSLSPASSFRTSTTTAQQVSNPKVGNAVNPVVTQGKKAATTSMPQPDDNTLSSGACKGFQNVDNGFGDVTSTELAGDYPFITSSWNAFINAKQN